MQIYPAIDLLEGKCVRLYKGDFDKVKVYSDTPVVMAKDIESQGADWLHLVDLEGARDPAKRQTALIRSIVENTGLKVQTGGGVRGADDVRKLIDAGASRVVIGSMAVRDIDATKALLAEFGADHITLAFDVKKDEGGVYKAAVSGWQETTDQSLTALVSSYLDDGLKHVLCTDIDKDGTMTGSNVLLYQIVARQFPGVQVQASGGVHNLDDLKALKAAGADGAIVGKAIYEGAFTVKQALAAMASGASGTSGDGDSSHAD